MGNSATNDIDAKDPKFQLMKDAAASLNREIQTENALFEESVLDSKEEEKLQITTVLKKKTFIDQKVSTNVDKLQDSVLSLVNGVLSGSSSVSTAIAAGLTAVATSALNNASMGFNK